MRHCLHPDIHHMHVWLLLTGLVKSTNTHYRIWLHRGIKAGQNLPWNRLAFDTLLSYEAGNEYSQIVKKRHIRACVSAAAGCRSSFRLSPSNTLLGIHWPFKGFPDGISCVENRSLDAYSIYSMCGRHRCIGNLPANDQSAGVTTDDSKVHLTAGPHLCDCQIAACGTRLI